MEPIGVFRQPVQPLRVDDFTLAVDDVIIFNHALADIEVVPFDAHLSLLDGFADHAVLDGFVFWEAGCLHQALDIVVGEAAHQVIVEAEIKTGLAGVALAPGAPAQLVIDAAGFVALGAEHEEAASIKHDLAIALDQLLRIVECLLPLGAGGSG